MSEKGKSSFHIYSNSCHSILALSQLKMVLPRWLFTLLCMGTVWVSSQLMSSCPSVPAPIGGRWWDCIALELQITLGEGICPKLFWAGPFQHWTDIQKVLGKQYCGILHMERLDSHQQTLRDVSYSVTCRQYCFVCVASNVEKKCRSPHICQVMTAHRSWTATEAEGKWHTQCDRC